MSPETASGEALVPHRGITPADARRLAIGLGVFALIAVAGLTWAKWWPYLGRLGDILDSDAYPGSNILEKAGPADAAPSLSGGWDFTVAYFQAVWQALVAALLISAGVLTLIPRLTVVLVPEYLVVVFIVGALRGWLFPFDGGAADWAGG